MDAFDDAFGETPPEVKSNGNGVEEEADPAAEFLAREQSNFAGLEDEIPAVGDLANGNEDVTNGNNGMGEFENIGENGLGVDDDFGLGGARPESPVNGTHNIFVQREEPEKIRIWREEQKRRLEVKDAEEEESKEKLREAAKKELDDWYKSYEDGISKTKNSNRNAEQDGAVPDASPTGDGKDWERIANLCDFNPKSTKQAKDISRMRSLILQLKQQPPQPSRRQSSVGNGTS